MSRRFAPRNDSGGGVIAPQCLAPADTPLSSACHCEPCTCTRAHVFPSACHCEPVRTLVWQSVFPAGKLGKLVVLRANSLRLTNSPEVLLSVTPYRRRSGLPRRFAPRNDNGGTYLPPLTHLCLQHVIANHVPAPAHTSFLQHVIANQCAHWCGNPFSPQGNLASW